MGGPFMSLFCRAWLSQAAIVSLALALTGCGGGGGDSGGSGGTGGTGGSSTFSYTLSTRSVVVKASTADSTYQTVVINFIINKWDQRPAQTGTVSQVSWKGTAISYASSTFGSIVPMPTDPNTATGTVTINFWNAAVLGAGTYTGSITFALCFDSTTDTCVNQAAGPASTIPVTMNVTGDARPSTTATLMTAALDLEAASSATIGPSRNVPLLLSNTSPGPFVTFDQPVNGFVASVTYSAIGSDNGTVHVFYMPPGSRALGTYTESLTVNVCIDAACAHPLRNSPFILSLTYTITGAAGTDFTSRVVGILARDIAWSPSKQRLYAIVSSGSPTNGQTLSEVDPTTAMVTRSLALLGEPTSLAISDDGTYAYVGFWDQSFVQRVALATMTADIAILLGTDPTNGPLHAGYMAVQPGQPGTVAIAKFATAPGLSDFGSQQIFLYDDAAGRSTAFGATNQGRRVDELAWNANGSILYAYDDGDLFTLTPSASGLAQAAVFSSISLGSEFQFNGGLIYGNNLSVIDPSSGATVGSLIADTSNINQVVLALDASLNRAYVFYDDYRNPSPLWTLETFNLQSRASLAMARIDSVSLGLNGLTGTTGRLVRWGTNGLAINANEGLVLINGSIVVN